MQYTAMKMFGIAGNFNIPQQQPPATDLLKLKNYHASAICVLNAPPLAFQVCTYIDVVGQFRCFTFFFSYKNQNIKSVK